MNPSVVTAGSSWLSPSRWVIRLSAVLQHQFPTHIKHCRSYKPKPQIFLPLKPSYCCQRWRTGMMRSCHLLRVVCCTGAHKALRCTLQQPHWFFFSQTSGLPLFAGPNLMALPTGNISRNHLPVSQGSGSTSLCPVTSSSALFTDSWTI